MPASLNMVTNLRVQPGVFVELQLISRLQESISLEEKSSLEGRLDGTTSQSCSPQIHRPNLQNLLAHCWKLNSKYT